jgi:hypothetical protein
MIDKDAGYLAIQTVNVAKGFGELRGTLLLFWTLQPDRGAVFWFAWPGHSASG